jgi:hypothetical protein
MFTAIDCSPVDEMSKANKVLPIGRTSVDYRRIAIYKYALASLLGSPFPGRHAVVSVYAMAPCPSLGLVRNIVAAVSRKGPGQSFADHDRAEVVPTENSIHTEEEGWMS